MKVLHLEGDEEFVQNCKEIYERHGLDYKIIVCEPRKQPKKLLKYLKREKPDFLVVTGHDSLANDKDPTKLKNYLCSKYYLKSVKIARDYCNDPDSLIIFAGACRSNFEELIKAGANFASSPGRILLNRMDPALIVALVANTKVDNYVSFRAIDEIVQNGMRAVGGILTRGKLRPCGPKVRFRKYQ